MNLSHYPALPFLYEFVYPGLNINQLRQYEGLGKIGYVANSSYTVIGESMSAGRLYDKIGDTAYAKVVLVTPAGTICKICKKSLKSEQEETA